MYSYESAGVVRRMVRQTVTARPVAWLSVRLLPSIDRLALRVSGGTLSRWVSGLPVVELTTTGARSGLPRTTFVLGIPDGDGLLVVAANFGETRNPAWYNNLRAHPAVSVAHGGISRNFVARELTGADRDEGFARAVRMNPGWLRFRDRAGERDIPVMRLEPVN